MTGVHNCASGAMIAQHMLAAALSKWYSRSDVKKELSERVGHAPVAMMRGSREKTPLSQGMGGVWIHVVNIVTFVISVTSWTGAKTTTRPA